MPCRSLGAKIALHLGVYHSSIFGKLVSDAGSAGGPTSSTAVLDAVDVGIPVAQRLQQLKTLLERPSNAATVCQWVLVSFCLTLLCAGGTAMEHAQSGAGPACAVEPCSKFAHSGSLLEKHAGPVKDEQ